MFNMNSTSGDRKKFLQTLLEEDAEEEEDETVATDEQINEMMARSQEERELFKKMDEERNAEWKKLCKKKRKSKR